MTLRSVFDFIVASPLMLVFVGVAMFVGGVAITYWAMKCCRGRRRRNDDAYMVVPDAEAVPHTPPRQQSIGPVVYYFELGGSDQYSVTAYVGGDNDTINAASALK